MHLTMSQDTHSTVLCCAERLLVHKITQSVYISNMNMQAFSSLLESLKSTVKRVLSPLEALGRKRQRRARALLANQHDSITSYNTLDEDDDVSV